MSALRLARGATGREPHPQVRGLLPRPRRRPAGRRGQRRGDPRASPARRAFPRPSRSSRSRRPTTTSAAVASAFERWGDEIAAVIVEPVAGNMGCVPPLPGFLEGLRALCDRSGALLIFDEVMTGFRVACGGAQRLYGVQPDLTCLGKIVGGGLPAAAYGGRRELMEQMAPGGPGLPGRDALGKSAGRWPPASRRCAGWPSPEPTRRSRPIAAAARARACAEIAPRRRGWSSAPPRSGACSASSSTPARSRNFEDAKQADEGALPRFFRRDARAGHLPGALALRVRLRLAGPRRADIDATLAAAEGRAGRAAAGALRLRRGLG